MARLGLKFGTAVADHRSVCRNGKGSSSIRKEGVGLLGVGETTVYGLSASSGHPCDRRRKSMCEQAT
jgi:hypothetical protein